MTKGKMKLLSGNGNRALAEAISKEIGMPLGNLAVGRFRDGETTVEIDETVRGMDVFLIQPTCTPVNENVIDRKSVV